jgi:hypothetical protein
MSEQFNERGYKPKYFIGDRVFGYWNEIPFVGSVGNDRKINDSGPEITIHLDLPIKYNDEIKRIVIVKHKDIAKLKEF